ncbi:DUF1643 domain-containing protein [Lampropedia puyangensis]|uniref:DUF1643 domain-containing protein n=1 Tax=Lampropedia puyangensis TaxID=1330072 RepID=A0A4S8ERT6_9BURK|nr:DUF1643 domain-containing protein [Lampropedia puyangensis]THT96053.1 DUF1643 domain-containing protein [Lampropedia puyangensis]
MYDIYHPDENDQWRYTLGRSGAKPLITIGLNPSTATQERLDPTVTRVERVGLQNGFDGFIMLNLYPVRATKYEDLPATADPVAYQRNLQAIERVIAAHPKAVLWAAWGDSIGARTYFGQARDDLYGLLAKHNPAWHHFGTLTDKGNPRHPSRLQYNWEFSPFQPASKSQ